ncbi:SMI1/KNR4 family protein [Priestia flexa]
MRVKLPKDFINFMKKYNGARPLNDVFTCTQHNI